MCFPMFAMIAIFIDSDYNLTFFYFLISALKLKEKKAL